MAEPQDKALANIGKHRGTYSPDVEIGADGKLYYARDIEEGEVIAVPMHMFTKAYKG